MRPKCFAGTASEPHSNLSEPLRPLKNTEARRGISVPWRIHNEVLALGTEGLRRLWSSLAPIRISGWRILPDLQLPSVKLSSSKGETCGRTATTSVAYLRLFCESSARGRCSMSAAAAVLPFIWAVGDEQYKTKATPQAPVKPQVAFYRKYTEAMLQRYARMSMEAGKVPSLLGQEMFRGKVTNYKVDSFEDVVIYLHDVDRCLQKLGRQQRDLISRICLQQYTLSETADMLGLKPRTVIRRYGQAVDTLTGIFLEVKLLEPLKCCQGGRSRNFGLSN